MTQTATVKSISDFLEKLAEINVASTKVPSFCIPSWPKEAEVSVALGKREFMLPVKDEKTKLFISRKVRKKIIFKINSAGEMTFIGLNWFDDRVFEFEHGSGNHNDDADRVIFLSLLQQFQEEVFSSIIAMLRSKLGEHNQIVERAQKAFEPFIPFVVADTLSG